MKMTDSRNKHGIRDRASSLFRGLLFYGMISLLSACGGGGGDDAGMITGTGFHGTSAVGAAIANATITIKSRSGVSISTTSDANGDFSSGELKENSADTALGPYLLRVSRNGGDYLYSVAHSENAEAIAAGSQSIAVNIHPFTDLIIRNWFARHNQDIEAAFQTGPIAQLPTLAQIQAISDEMLAILKQALAANNAATDLDLIASPFQVGDGFDNLLDNSIVIINNQITITILQPGSDDAVQTNIIDNVDVDTDFTSSTDTPPTTPANLRALAAASDEVVVVWDPSSDDKGVTGYQVYRNGVLIATTAFPVYRDTGLSSNVDYGYTVVAIDSRGQLSAATPVAAHITLSTPDTTSPPIATSVQGSEDGVSITLSWAISDISDVSGFRIYRGASGNVDTSGEPLAVVTATTLRDFDVSPGANYCYRIVTFDAAANTSAATAESCVTVSGASATPSTLAFSDATYSVVENAASISISVVRSGDLSEAISVDYATTAISATAGTDYIETSGTLNWPALDTSAKTFTVMVMENSGVETDETVQLTLSNPSSNTALGNTATAILTITDAPQVSCIDLVPTAITVNTTLSEPCYNVTSDLTVSNNATLTINPGVKLVFSAGIGLDIDTDGVLLAVGTAQAPITFTSAIAASGFWDGLEINSIATSQLDHVIIEYGGNSSSYNEANLGISFDGKVSLLNSTIRHSAGYGVSLIRGTLSAFSGNTITLNEQAPLYMPARQAGSLAQDNSFAGNDTVAGGNQDFIELFTTGTIDTNQTWRAFDVDYHLTGVSHTVGAVLTIAPGATLVFSSGTMFYINNAGTLKAIGTAAQPITFTGLTQSDGFWGGIQFSFNPNDNVMDHTIVEYGGSGGNSLANVGVFGTPGKLTLSNSTLRHSSQNGFNFYPGTVFTMQNVSATANARPGWVGFNEVGLLDTASSYSGNTDDRVFVQHQTLSNTQTMHKLDVPYFLEGASINWIEAALTIEAGSEIQFDANAGIDIRDTGTLIAQGNAQQPIVFTGAQQTKGYWDGIAFTFTQNPNVIDYAVIEYAGPTSNYSEGLVRFIGTGSLASNGSVTNSTLRGSLTNGIYITGDTSGDFSTGNTFIDIDNVDLFIAP